MSSIQDEGFWDIERDKRPDLGTPELGTRGNPELPLEQSLLASCAEAGET